VEQVERGYRVRCMACERGDRRAIRPKQRVRHCWCWACRIVGCGNRGSRWWPSLEVLRISTAPTAITSGEEKDPQNGSFSRRSIRGRYLSWRSITYRLWAIASNHTAREKVLQIPTLRAVRSMRAILCWGSFASAVR